MRKTNTNIKPMLKILKGFLIFAIPPFVLHIVTIIMNSFYSIDILISSSYSIIKFGILGVLLSFIYLIIEKYISKYNKLISKIVLIIYYTYFLILLVVVVYFRLTGPLFS